MISGHSPEDNQERRGRVWVDIGSSLAYIAVPEVVSVEGDVVDIGNDETNNQGE